MSELPDIYSNNFISGIENFKTNYKEIDFRDTDILKLILEHQDSTIKSLYVLREKYIEEKKKEEKKLLKQKLNDLFLQIDEIIKNADSVNGIKIISQKIEINNSEEFKEIGESFRNKLKNGVALIASIIDGKINLVCVVSDNLIKDKNLNAGKLISVVAKELGGGGGGKPHLATAGGKYIDKLDEVLKNFITDIKNKI